MIFFNAERETTVRGVDGYVWITQNDDHDECHTIKLSPDQLRRLMLHVEELIMNAESDTEDT